MFMKMIMLQPNYSDYFILSLLSKGSRIGETWLEALSAGAIILYTMPWWQITSTGPRQGPEPIRNCQVLQKRCNSIPKVVEVFRLYFTLSLTYKNEIAISLHWSQVLCSWSWSIELVQLELFIVHKYSNTCFLYKVFANVIQHFTLCAKKVTFLMFSLFRGVKCYL